MNVQNFRHICCQVHNYFRSNSSKMYILTYVKICTKHMYLHVCTFNMRKKFLLVIFSSHVSWHSFYFSSSFAKNSFINRLPGRGFVINYYYYCYNNYYYSTVAVTAIVQKIHPRKQSRQCIERWTKRDVT